MAKTITIKFSNDEYVPDFVTSALVEWNDEQHYIKIVQMTDSEWKALAHENGDVESVTISKKNYFDA